MGLPNQITTIPLSKFHWGVCCITLLPEKGNLSCDTTKLQLKNKHVSHSFKNTEIEMALESL